MKLLFLITNKILNLQLLSLIFISLLILNFQDFDSLTKSKAFIIRN